MTLFSLSPLEAILTLVILLVTIVAILGAILWQKYKQEGLIMAEIDESLAAPVKLPKRLTVYIAGPVTGLPYDDVCNAFEAKERELERQGFIAINPCKLGIQPDSDWIPAMRTCITVMMGADAICLLDGWENSKGARLERYLAMRLEMSTIN